MKKLKLDLQDLNAEVLTRNQLKTIFGGVASGGITHGNCGGGDPGAWDYVGSVTFAQCQQDVWDYCPCQCGNCY